jgi:hypothetical protein
MYKVLYINMCNNLFIINFVHFKGFITWLHLHQGMPQNKVFNMYLIKPVIIIIILKDIQIKCFIFMNYMCQCYWCYTSSSVKW